MDQYIGAKKGENVKRTIGSIIYIFIIFAVIVTILMVILNSNITKLMHTPKEAFEYTKNYILICSIGIPFIVGYNVVSGILRGLGNSKASLYFIAIACVINIIVDIILIGFFNLGEIGAAIATIGSQAISLIVGIMYIKRTSFSKMFLRRYIRFDGEVIKNVFKLGLPIATQDALVNISFLIITAIINNLGVVASASVGIVEKIIIFAMLVPSSFASAIAVMTAQNIGAGKEDRAIKSLYLGIGISLIFGVAFCGYSQVFPETITMIFSNDKLVIEGAALYLRSYSIDTIMVAFIFCMNSFFSGCGHSLFPMIHSLIATFFVRIPGSYFLSKIQGITLYEIGFAAPTATMLSIIICIVYYKSGYWRKSTIIKLF